MPFTPPWPLLIDMLRASLNELRRLAEKHPSDARVQRAAADIEAALAHLEAPDKPETAA